MRAEIKSVRQSEQAAASWSNQRQKKKRKEKRRFMAESGKKSKKNKIKKKTHRQAQNGRPGGVAVIWPGSILATSPCSDPWTLTSRRRVCKKGQTAWLQHHESHASPAPPRPATRRQHRHRMLRAGQASGSHGGGRVREAVKSKKQGAVVPGREPRLETFTW